MLPGATTRPPQQEAAGANTHITINPSSAHNFPHKTSSPVIHFTISEPIVLEDNVHQQDVKVGNFSSDTFLPSPIQCPNNEAWHRSHNGITPPYYGRTPPLLDPYNEKMPPPVLLPYKGKVPAPVLLSYNPKMSHPVPSPYNKEMPNFGLSPSKERIPPSVFGPYNGGTPPSLEPYSEKMPPSALEPGNEKMPPLIQLPYRGKVLQPVLLSYNEKMHRSILDPYSENMPRSILDPYNEKMPRSILDPYNENMPRSVLDLHSENIPPSFLEHHNKRMHQHDERGHLLGPVSIVEPDGSGMTVPVRDVKQHYSMKHIYFRPGVPAGTLGKGKDGAGGISDLCLRKLLGDRAGDVKPYRPHQLPELVTSPQQTNIVETEGVVRTPLKTKLSKQRPNVKGVTVAGTASRRKRGNGGGVAGGGAGKGVIFSDNVEGDGANQTSPGKHSADDCDPDGTSKKSLGPTTRHLKMVQWDRGIVGNSFKAREVRLLREVGREELAQQTQSDSWRRRTRVLVVGAGMAGLTVADALLAHGFTQVTVLEASNRLGGRIHTVRQEAGSITCLEMGVDQVDGIDHWETSYRIAALTNNRLNQGGIFKKSIPTVRKDIMTEKCRCEAIPHLLDRSICYPDMALDHDISALKSLRSKSDPGTIFLASKDFFREKLRRYPQDMSRTEDNDLQLLIPKATQRMAQHITDMQVKHGDDTGQADVLQFFTDTSPAPNNNKLYLKLGMDSLFNPLKKRFGTETVVYKAKVTHVDWSEFKVKNVRENCDPQVCVTCSDGRQFSAHHVIMTVPLGVLKSQAHSLFSPPLPDWKKDTIYNIGFGAVGKVFLSYPCTVCEEGFDVYLQRQKDAATDTVPPTGPEGIGSSKSKFREMGEGGEGVGSVDRSVVRAQCYPDSNHIVEITLSDARHEAVPEADLKKTLLDLLERQLPTPLVLPQQSPRLASSKWRSNALFGGTHPYIRADRGPKDAADLARPVTFRSRPVIQFAGDATHDDYSSLLNAARASGLREAHRLFDLYNASYGRDNRCVTGMKAEGSTASLAFKDF